jgi:hypothetical protein
MDSTVQSYASIKSADRAENEHSGRARGRGRIEKVPAARRPGRCVDAFKFVGLRFVRGHDYDSGERLTDDTSHTGVIEQARTRSSRNARYNIALVGV